MKSSHIHNLYNKIKKKFVNAPLQKKFHIIICFVMALCSIGSILGLQLFYIEENKMLYQSMKGSVEHSASLISDKLNTIEYMTAIMLADSTLQDNLSIAIDPNSNNLKKSDAFRALSYAVPDYYQNYKQYGINYINLYNTNYISYSNYSRSLTLPDEIETLLLENAHSSSGYPIWNTDYCNTYGLFISRDVRRIESLQLDTIGTILVNIDLESLIADCTEGYWIKDTPLYLIYKDQSELFHSKSIDQDNISKILEKATKDYGVIRFDKKYYFYTKETIPSFNWEYISFTPYDSVINAQHLYLFLSSLIIIVMFFIAVGLSRKMFDSITIHFSNLLQKMNFFGKNDTQLLTFDYDYDSREDEIGELHQRFDQMALQVQELIQKNYVSEILKKEAELKSLENQINPHFLYNTLESINWRAQALGVNDISIMVNSLGTLLRTTLSRTDTSLSTLKNEIDVVKDYMAIIQIRFDDKLQYSINVPEELFEISIPKLSLQPLVENAINYALEEMTETCYIQINARQEKSNIIITITNNGSQFPEDLLNKLSNNEISPHGFGIGLLNIQKRIKLQFGNDYGLTLKNNELLNLAIVEIKIPDTIGISKNGVETT